MNAVVAKLLPWIALTLAVAWGGSLWWMHHKGWAAGAASVQAQLDRRNAEIAEERTRASEAARKAEQAHAQALAAATNAYHEELTHAQATSDRLVADLRAGNIQLRDHWNACLAAASLPGAAAGAASADAAAELRRESAARIVRYADEADATIRALQAIVTADRQATTPPSGKP